MGRGEEQRSERVGGVWRGARIPVRGQFHVFAVKRLEKCAVVGPACDRCRRLRLPRVVSGGW